MKNKEMNLATSRRTQQASKLALAPIYGVLLGILCLIAAAPVAHAQKVVNPTGTILDFKPKPPLKITTISGKTVTASDPVSGETIQFTQATPLNIGQTIWRTGTKAQGAIFPVNGTEKTRVGGGDWMETTVKLSNNGRLDGKTRTWTTACLDGFTGGVRVFLLDKTGNPDLANTLIATPLKKWGVNGECVPGASSVTNLWDFQVPLDLLNKTKSIRIAHVKKPTDRIDEFLEKAKEVAEVLQAFAEVYETIAGAGGGTPGGTGPTQPKKP